MVVTAPTLRLILRLRGFAWQREQDYFSGLCSVCSMAVGSKSCVMGQAVLCDELHLNSRSISTSLATFRTFSIVYFGGLIYNLLTQHNCPHNTLRQHLRQQLLAKHASEVLLLCLSNVSMSPFNQMMMLAGL